MLPIDRTMVGAYRIMWAGRISFLRTLVLPGGIVFLLGVLVDFAAETASWLLFTAVFMASLPVSVWFAVATHRLALLGPGEETPVFRLDWSRRHNAFLGRLLFLFFVVPILMVLVLAIVGGIVAVVVSEPSTEAVSDFAGFSMMLFWVAYAYVFCRLSVVFPSIAIDRPLSIAAAWELTSGNGLRLLVLVALLPAVFGYPFEYVRTTAGFWGGSAFAALGIPVLAFEIVILSLAYKYLIDAVDRGARGEGD